jgi:transcriptional antiterminator NusG
MHDKRKTNDGQLTGVIDTLAATTTAWFALRTAPRAEKQVHARLVGRGIEAFLPLWERWSRWKDRRMRIAVPLFPGYCFARFDGTQRKSVVMTAGVASIVGSSRGPEPIPEHEIAGLETLGRSRLTYDPHPGLAEGMHVEVTRGPLTGVRGILVRKEARCRLVICVTAILQGATVEIDAADVVPA